MQELMQELILMIFLNFPLLSLSLANLNHLQVVQKAVLQMAHKVMVQKWIWVHLQVKWMVLLQVKWMVLLQVKAVQKWMVQNQWVIHQMVYLMVQKWMVHRQAQKGMEWMVQEWMIQTLTWMRHQMMLTLINQMEIKEPAEMKWANIKFSQL
jgi:hypothetical protein